MFGQGIKIFLPACLTVVLFLLPGLVCEGCEVELPRNVHLSFESDPASSIIVVWETSTPQESQVQYGKEKEYSATAYSKGRRRVHEVKLKGLESDTIYHYRCGSPGRWSTNHTFRTAPLGSHDVSFVILGDSRNDPGELRMDEWREVAYAASQEDISFSLFCGDMILCGLNPWEWEAFFSSASGLLLKAPFITTLGNHEYRSPIYFHRFALPGNEEWYSFDYGNVHVVVLNTETSLLTSLDPELFPADMGPGSEQYEWLEADLSQVPDNQWKVVMFHRPPYSCGPHGDQADVQLITHLFDEYSVDLVFCGHDHLYQRSKPIYKGRVSEEGTIYMVSGGAGAPLYEVGNDSRIEYAESCYHYILVKTEKNSLCLQAKRPDGEVFDSLTLVKEAIAKSTDPGGMDSALISLIKASNTEGDKNVIKQC
jgi:hypothetical protein